ncbi:MAG: type I asparaginase [Daejeonella sp.]|uniref:asparaginase n=1 Tax=Daejeonella sp. TaxID=2805397 RepID=UPI003C794B81
MTNVLIIYTGGTIGMVTDPKSGVLVPFNFDQITDNVPELKRLDYNFKVYSFDPLIDSSNMSPQIYKELVSLIQKNYEKYDGFVILHGSDTMSFTASALSFMIENLAKPIILTGSQLPVNGIRTDAKENLITALEIAAARKRGKAVVPEVCIYFDYKLFRGNRSFKYNSDKFEAFRSPNCPVLAEAGVHLEFNKNDILRPGDGPVKFHKKLDSAIGVLKLYPGISPQIVKAALNADCKAIIMETFGSGNTSTEDWFLELLKEAIADGKLILNISQCKVGTVALGRYETSRQLQEMGVVSGFDMTFEAAVTKLMFLLGNFTDRKKIAQLLETNLRGEMTLA